MGDLAQLLFFVDGSAGFLSTGQEGALKAYVGATLPRSTRQVGAWIEQEFGLVYESLHQWDEAIAAHSEALGIARKLGNRIQEGIILNNLANVYRGSQLESFHTGSIVVVDARGRVVALAGDPSFRICLRSAAKPFQAFPLLEYGGVEEYELSGEEIALTCASHWP